MNNIFEQNHAQSIVVSVIAPLFNEQDAMTLFLDRLKASLAGLNIAYEIILVDDGSQDGTWEYIKKFAKEDATIKGISLSKNFGQQHALLAGLTFASGSALVCMDGDLQHPPELIPQLFAAWQKGYKIVNTTRISNAKTSLFKRLTSKYFYKFFSFMSSVPIHEGTSDFRLIDRQVFNSIVHFRDVDFFIRGMVQWVGFSTTSIPYQEQPRQFGQSKYNFFKMLKLALSGIIAFSSLPLKLGIWVGILTSFLAFLEVVYILIKFFQGVTVPGWASTVGILSFLFGVLFILLGCIGIYLANIHEHLKNRPKFIVNEKVNICDPL